MVIYSRGFQPGVATAMEVVCLLSGAARVSAKNIHNHFYIIYFVYEPLFVVAKIIGSFGKNDALYFFIQNCFKCGYDHYSTVVFGNAGISLRRKNVLCL